MTTTTTTTTTHQPQSIINDDTLIFIVFPRGEYDEDTRQGHDVYMSFIYHRLCAELPGISYHGLKSYMLLVFLDGEVQSGKTDKRKEAQGSARKRKEARDLRPANGIFSLPVYRLNNGCFLKNVPDNGLT